LTDIIIVSSSSYRKARSGVHALQGVSTEHERRLNLSDIKPHSRHSSMKEQRKEDAN